MSGWLATLGASTLSGFMRESAWAFPAAEATHVAAFTTALGTICVVDLRLLGWAWAGRSVREVCAEALPLTWGAFLLAACSGALLFCADPSGYAANAAFRFKLLLLACAGANAAFFHLVTCADLPLWERGTSRGARLAGAVSLCCWVGMVLCGRWIAFLAAPKGP